jgi:hypothetical protein
MSTRFDRDIASGAVASVAQLKAAFKAEAKRLHPDLSSGDGADFVRLRRDYEAALAAVVAGGPAAPAGSAGSAGTGNATDGAASSLAAGLGRLLKRGWPKEPRHAKERLRYRQARLGFLAAAAAGGTDGRFLAAEAALLAAGTGTAATEEVVLWLSDWRRAVALPSGGVRQAALAALGYALRRRASGGVAAPAGEASGDRAETAAGAGYWPETVGAWLEGLLAAAAADEGADVEEE